MGREGVRLATLRFVASSATEFNYAALKGRAGALAAAEYRPPEKLAAQFLRDLTYARVRTE